MTDKDKDAMMLFLLRELERLNILVDRLRASGVISERDHALAQLESELRDKERRAKVGMTIDDAKLKALRRRIERLEHTGVQEKS